MMKFIYKLRDGSEIKDYEFVDIINYYEAACTAELIQGDYFPGMSDELALEIGREVRRRMNKCEYCDGELELDTIADVLCEFKDAISEWLLKNQSVTRDYNKQFNVKLEEDNDVDVEDMVGWIYQNQNIAQSFEEHFLNNHVF